MLQHQLWNGLTLGALYSLIAVGYTLIFGIIQVIFFAQGELSMLAAFAAMLVWLWAAKSVPVAVVAIGVVVAAILVSVVAGLASEHFALRPLRNAPRVLPLITSLGLSIVFQNIVMLATKARAFPFPIKLPEEIAGFHSAHFVELSTVVLAAVVFGALHMVLRTERFGLPIRAVAQSRDGARLMGIDADRAIQIAFVISSTTAALAGLLMGLYYGVVKFDMGFVPGIKGFTIAILGGIGNVTGALVAGLLVGISEALFAGYVSSDYKDLFVFAILVLTLLVRPHGLLGEGE